HRRREFIGKNLPRMLGLKQFGGPTYRNPGLETLREWIGEAHDAGVCVSVHSVDDDACAETIDAFEPCGSGGPRHRLVHARSLKRRDIARIVQLGLVVEAQPWDTFDDPRISDDPDAVPLPLRSLLDA